MGESILPMAATSDTASILFDLFLVLLAAKLGDELFKRIGQPVIVGEILGGVLVGPSVLGLVEIGEVLRVFSELGVVVLLFWVGLQTHLSEMKAVGRVAARARRRWGPRAVHRGYRLSAWRWARARRPASSSAPPWRRPAPGSPRPPSSTSASPEPVPPAPSSAPPWSTTSSP
jgi:hypothetical protein